MHTDERGVTFLVQLSISLFLQIITYLLLMKSRVIWAKWRKPLSTERPNSRKLGRRGTESMSFVYNLGTTNLKRTVCFIIISSVMYAFPTLQIVDLNSIKVNKYNPGRSFKECENIYRLRVLKCALCTACTAKRKTPLEIVLNQSRGTKRTRAYFVYDAMVNVKKRPFTFLSV